MVQMHLLGKGSTYGFCAGDCNPATTVGGGSAGSTTAQANKNYLAVDPTFDSNNGRVTIMNGASAGSGAIGIGQDSTATGFIHFGDADKKFYFEGRNTTSSLNIFANSETLLSVDGANKRIGLGENVTDPYCTVEIRETGTAKANTDILALTNKTNAADMDGTEGSILFNQYYYDASTPAIADSGRISVGTETDWTSTGSTQDSYMAFETSLDGTVNEKMRITSAGYVGVGTTSPTSHLHVVGDITATGTITSNKYGRTSDTSRYALEEYFDRKPQLNATSIIDPDADNATTLAAFVKASRHFEILGTGASDANVTYDGATATTKFTTVGSTTSDSMIVLPHLDHLTAQNAGAQTAWTGVLWGTENQVVWECCILSDSVITDSMYYAGLKLTNTHLYATDNDQAYFFYDSSKTILNNAGAPGSWHFVYSVGGTDYVTNLNLAAHASTIYHLKIEIDETRAAKAYINGVQYGLTQISGVGDTGVNVNGTVGLSSGQSSVIAVDGTDATTQIVVGDILTNASGDVWGTVTAVTSATSITITSVQTKSFPDDSDIYIYGRAASSSTTKSSALGTVDLIPYIGVVKHTNSTARHLRVAYQKISREISTS